MKNKIKRLQKIVGEQLNIESTRVKLDADFVKDLGADSLDVIELIITIEYEFDLNIKDRYASKIKTIRDVLNYIEEKPL
jgi:acyl carrier protein